MNEITRRDFEQNREDLLLKNLRQSTGSGPRTPKVVLRKPRNPKQKRGTNPMLGAVMAYRG